MSHHDAQHYAAKHAPDTTLNPAIAAGVQRLARNGKITCAQAHQLAADLDVSPFEVGKTLDLLEIRIAQCQLGLFAKRENPAAQIHATPLPPAVMTSLERITEPGKPVSCRKAWDFAAQQNVSRASVGAACNALQIKIVACQLGTF